MVSSIRDSNSIHNRGGFDLICLLVWIFYQFVLLNPEIISNGNHLVREKVHFFPQEVILGTVRNAPF